MAVLFSQTLYTKLLPSRTTSRYIVLIFINLQLLLSLIRCEDIGHTQGISPTVNGRIHFNISEEQIENTLVGRIPTRDNLQYRFSEEPDEFSLNPITGEIRTKKVIDRESLPEDSFNLFVQNINLARHLIEVRITVLDINDNSPIFDKPTIQVLFSENDQPGTQIILDTATDKDIGINGVTTDYRIVSGNDEGKFRLVLPPDTSIPLLYLENTIRLDREEKMYYQLHISVPDGAADPRYGYLTVNITVRDINDNPPLFDQSDYSASLNETAGAETVIVQVQATDRDIGRNGDITYSIVNDDYDQFAIDPHTGVVKTKKVLICERTCSVTADNCKPRSCVVTVQATDSGHPYPQSGRAYITVTLIDENNHKPNIAFGYIPRNLSHAVVDEGANENTVVATVSVTDKDDGLNGQTVSNITGGNEMGHFKLNSPLPGLNLVKVAGRLDRELVSRYNLTIEAHDKGTPQQYSKAFLIIIVNDVNDHAPVFQYLSYSAELSELIPVGSYVASVTARDNDTGINAQISYSIVSGNELGWFKIDPNTGLITTRKVLDREIKDKIVISIRAQDQASKPFVTIAKLTVSVWDENDVIPTFPKESYTATIVEESETPAELVTVEAEDRDIGPNGTVRYSLLPEVETKYPGFFHVNAMTGTLTVMKKVDREENEQFVVNIKAEDQGNPPMASVVSVYVNVSDINDNPPNFYPVNYFARVPENQASISHILQVIAFDKDTGINSHIRFKIESGADGIFEIDENNGWISSTLSLDRETRSNYRLTISARDSGGLQSLQLAVVDLTVADVQDNPPVFQQPSGYSFEIVEDDGLKGGFTGRLVGQVRAESRDLGVSFTYSITDGDIGGYFRIDSDGRILTAKPIDREYQNLYKLTVIAKGGSMYAETTVNVSIADVNDNRPQFVANKIEGYVVENWPVDHDVFLAKADDPDDDINGTVTYSLAPQPSEFFQVDSKTGRVVLSKPLTQTIQRLFNIIVTAKDAGKPSLSSSMQLTITVRDVNDHTPIFQQKNYDVSVVESQPVNERFFRVSAYDSDDGLNGEITYDIITGNHGNCFGIFPDGLLYIAQELDREEKDLFVLTIRASDKGVERRSSTANVTVHILDANDNSPTFSNTTYNMYLAEHSQVDTFVGIVYASDLDTGRNAEISYRIDTSQSYLVIDSVTGVITSRQVIDREELLTKTGRDYVMVDVVVVDNGEPKKHDKALVKVIVKDINDNAPEFLQTSHEASVYENAPVDSLIVRATAVDKDYKANALVHYQIISGNIGEKFTIDEQNGQVSVSLKLDREVRDRYELTILAQDAGSPPLNASAQVRIMVLDYNDNAPQFLESEREIKVLETAEIEQVLTQVTALDKDLGNNAEVSYSIQGNNYGNAFHIDSTNGKISVAERLDYEKRNKYILNITASDLGEPKLSSSILLTVNVLDYNDNEPHFTTGSIVRQIQEGVETGTSVLFVRALDPDSGIYGELRYTLTQIEPAGDHFVIDEITGLISTKLELDREFAASFTLQVTATDQALPETSRKSAKKIVTIMIEDINDNAPKFISTNAVPVLLGTGVSTKITTVKAIDLDAGANGKIEYQVFSGDTTVFRIDKSTGDLYLRSSLSSQMLTYDLTVKASDMGINDPLGQKFSYFQMTVFVEAAVENGPTFTRTQYSGEVYENEAKDTTVVTVSASYPVPRADANIEYYVTDIRSNGTSQPRYFQIHPTIGTLTTTEELDRERGYHVFQVHVYCIDKNSNTPSTRKSTVQVNLLDRNDSPPKFSALGDLPVSEDTESGYVIATLVAIDLDLEGVVKYGIIGGDRDKFSVHPSTGDLKVSGELDRETQSLHTLTVSASDGVQSSETLVRIIVTDVNDEPPQYSQPYYSFDIPEDTPMAARVGQISASDPDSGHNSKLTFSLLSHWGKDIFSLDSSNRFFTLIGSLDYEQVQHYILTVKVQDKGVKPLSSTVTVYMNVLDVNDNAPAFDPSTYSKEVWENATLGTTVLNVTATDRDSGRNGEVEYSIVGGDPGGQFSINPSSGAIVIRKTLDREVQAYYNLAIQARDMAESPVDRLSSTAVVTVILKDVNDNAPEFITPNRITVMENSAVAAPVFKLIAKDPDEGRNSYVEYHLTSPSTSVFSLESMDGVLRVRQPLDRETVDKYELTVKAVDKGIPSKETYLQLVVDIGDNNDNDPIFNPVIYTADLSENTKPGESFLTLSATDADAGRNAQLRHVIIEGDDNRDFWLDSANGQLSVHKHLDYERHREYTLKVLVEDLGDSARSDTATVSVTVRDVNDCPPVFVDSPYVAYVQENVANLPVHVLGVTARDDDSKPNAGVTYSILNGDLHDVFAVNSSTGEITALKTLDRERETEYQLVLTAYDSGSPRLTGTATVRVLVGDVNDNRPIFHHSHYTSRLQENLTPPVTVLHVTATDDDIDNNAKITYHLAENGGGQFAIDPTTGEIVTTASLDREKRESYELIAIATDEGSLPLSGVAVVRVEVEDKNDHHPEFLQRSYSVHIRDDTSAGLFVLGVTAVDMDTGSNGLVDYTLFGSDDTSYFNINRHTGVITAARTLLRSKGTYHFNVRATDKGQNPLYSVVAVSVQFLTTGTTLFPVFQQTQQTFRLSEATGIDYILHTLHAVSPSGGSLRYSIAGGNTGQSFIMMSSGEIKVNQKLDYERTNSYSLWIEASDDNDPPLSDFIHLSVEVTDENDNVPVFDMTFYNASVSEGESSPQGVITVTATDTDSGDNGRVSYDLIAGNVGGAFDIDISSGRIRTAATLDRETLDSYMLVVTATDHGDTRLSSTATVDVKVMDKNDHRPRFTQHFNTRIYENARKGSFVIRITSTDEDIGDNALHTYSLTDNPGGMFAIDRTSGNVTVAGILDRETKYEYILKVAANDGAYNAETNLYVDIMDVNDNAPLFHHSAYAFVAVEHQPEGSTVGNVSATDNDADGPNSEIYYRWKTPTRYFNLDPEIGRITVREPIEYDTVNGRTGGQNTHALKVEAVDRGEPSHATEVAVTIFIRRANAHAPVFEKSEYFVAIAENTNLGSSVLQVIASDNDHAGENAVIDYDVIDSNATHHFTLDKHTGWIVLRNSVAGKMKVQYRLQIEARDRGRPPKVTEATVYIQVVKVNQHAPQFVGDESSFRTSLSEDQSVGHLIAKLTATDSDQGIDGLVSYYLSNESDPTGLFSLDQNDGQLKLEKPLDYETAKVHQLNIIARDRSLIPRESRKIFTISVRDINDSPPTFPYALYDAYVEENSASGTIAMQVNATDLDSPSNGQIKYYITGHEHAMDKFSIDEDTGVIISLGSMDYELVQEYEITVKALNPGTALSGLCTVRVHVTGKNEHIPHFLENEYSFVVSESAQPAHTIGRVRAQDDDNGIDGVVYYYLVGDSNMKGFAIDHGTGAVIIDDPIDREAAAEISLDVMAKNDGPIRGNNTARCRVRVVVRDANDPPQFTQSIYEGSVPEGTGSGVSVMTVSAVDNDVQSQDRQFTYRILAGNNDGTFDINAKLGLIRTQGILDRETIGMYNLTVAAVDQGNPPKTGSALVKIYLEDRNDNGPYFVPAVPVGKVRENKPPQTEVIKLYSYTRDLDITPNQGPYQYRLLNHTKEFQVDLPSGIIKTKVRLDRESKAEYYLKLEVTDNGKDVTMTSTLNVKVDILDDNDNPSTERPLRVLAYAYDGRFPAAGLADVRPRDPDTVGNYSCQIVGGDTSLFRVPNGCSLYANIIHNIGTYQLNVSGSDGVHGNVRYPVNVEFKRFEKAAVDNSIVVRLENLKLSEFLENHYNKFLAATQDSFSGSEEVILFNMASSGNGNVLVFIAVRKADSQYISRSMVSQKISARSVEIERLSGMKLLDIDYNPCHEDLCLHSTRCTYTMTLAENVRIVDSPLLVFTAPEVRQDLQCTCKNGFTGVKCDVPINKCNDGPCQNGGTCNTTPGSSTYQCQCSSAWTGDTCEQDVNECVASNPCQHGGTCENQIGSYNCRCASHFTGQNCEIGIDFCSSSPCRHGSTCDDKLSRCLCRFGDRGQTCESRSTGFQSLSYIQYDLVLNQQSNTIIMEFATVQKNALLLYYPVRQDMFIAVEVVDGKVTFSFALDDKAVRLEVSKTVADGRWYRLEAKREGKVGSLKVRDCPAESDSCSVCVDGDDTCYSRAETTQYRLLAKATNVLFIGGVRYFDVITLHNDHVTTHDFVGCMRNVMIDRTEWSQIQPTASNHTTAGCSRTQTGSCLQGGCGQGAVCVDKWFTYDCHCIPGTKCEAASAPFTFGGESMVSFEEKESYRRNQIMSKSRRKRAAPTNSESRRVSMLFQSKEEGGILFSSANAVLYVQKEFVQYRKVASGNAADGVVLDGVDISDGSWHNVSLKFIDSLVILSVDGVVKTLDSVVGMDLSRFAIGGSPNDVTYDKEVLKGFNGCLKDLQIDGQSQPFNGTSDRYEAKPIGSVASGCQGIGAVAGGAPVEVIVPVVLLFFIIIIVVLLVIFLVRRRKRKNTARAGKQNGSVSGIINNPFLDHTINHRIGRSEEDIIGQHITEELASKSYNEREVSDQLLTRPDIITPEGNSAETKDNERNGGVENQGFIEEPQPEHYDIDNASSIAPSDLMDVVPHYKHYRQKLWNKNDLSSQQKHAHSRPGNTPWANGNRPINASSRQSPATVGGMRASPGPIQPVKTPLDGSNHLSRRSPYSPLGPPITSHNIPPGGAKGSSLRSTPLSGLNELYASNASSSSTAFSDRALPNGRLGNKPAAAKLRQPINQVGNRLTPTLGLTVEEVERLNSRSRASPLDTMDAPSSSSDGMVKDTVNRTDFTHADLRDPASMMPVDSSSDDDTNDSFTCSEFECDSEKIRNDIHSNNRLLPSLARVDEAEDADVSRAGHTDLSDSISNRDGSVSTFFTVSEDENAGSKSKGTLPDNLNWDSLLNWGPNFEKLVGVFKDIAQLPDVQSGGTKSQLEHRNMNINPQRGVSPRLQINPSKSVSSYRSNTPVSHRSVTPSSQIRASPQTVISNIGTHPMVAPGNRSNNVTPVPDRCKTPSYQQRTTPPSPVPHYPDITPNSQHAGPVRQAYLQNGVQRPMSPQHQITSRHASPVLSDGNISPPAVAIGSNLASIKEAYV